MSPIVDPEGTWWQQRPDGVWLRWDGASGTWQESARPPAAVGRSAGAPPPPPPPGSPPRPPSHWGTPPPPPGTPPGAGHAAPPPGAPAYPWTGTGGGDDAPVDLSRNARTTVIFLALMAIYGVLVVIVDLRELSFIERAASGRFSSQGEFEAAARANQARTGVVNGLNGLLLLITGVSFLMWFRRAYENLPRLGARNLRYKPGWAVGGWLVPILNVWRPKQIANDIWRASDPYLPRHQGQTWQERPVPKLLNAWWAAWLFGNVYFFFGTPRSIEAARVSAIVNTMTDVIGIVAAVLAIQVVRAITERQAQRMRAIALNRAP